MIGFTTDNVDVNGTWLQGYVKGTRREIEATFGKPEEWGDGDKVTTEWSIRFDDGTIATIYDWKRYELGAPKMDERIEWHIGGRNALAVERVEDALIVYA